MDFGVGRFLVPLTFMYTKKWEMPLISFDSYLEPVATKTRTVAVLVSAIGTVKILNPFGNVVFLYMGKVSNFKIFSKTPPNLPLSGEELISLPDKGGLGWVFYPNFFSKYSAKFSIFTLSCFIVSRSRTVTCLSSSESKST